MGTLIDVVDFIVLLLFIVYVPRTVLKGSGSLVLSIFIALAVVIFAMVSFTADAGLVTRTSPLTQVILLVFLMGMAALARASSAGNAVA